MTMQSTDVEDLYKLSPIQQGMLFHYLYQPASGVYFEQFSWEMRGPIDIELYRRAWQELAKRAPMLRTSFHWEDLDEPLQVVHRQVEVPLTALDWREMDANEHGQALDRFLQDDLERGFDLRTAPLMRLTLIQTGADDYIVVWSYHHLLLDGWSVPLVLGDVMALYEAFVARRPVALPRRRPYRDYIRWLQQRSAAASEPFWRERFADLQSPTPLGMDRALPAGPHRYGELSFTFSTAETEQMQAMLRANRLTIGTLVQGAWALALSSYSGMPDVTFGVTVSGRPAGLAGSEQMLGCFINTLPMRVQVGGDTVAHWLDGVQQQQIALHDHSHTPLVTIQGVSGVPRSLPLFESIVVYENFPRASTGTSARTRIIQRTNYPLTVVGETRPDLTLRLAYDTTRFDEPTVARMLRYLQTIIRAMAADPHQSLAAAAALPMEERTWLLAASGSPAAAIPARTLPEQIRAQAATTPDAPAVVYGNEAYSYGWLTDRADRLATALRAHGVGPEDRVAVWMRRSPLWAVALLGTLGAGAAYLPLDTSMPAERLAFVLEDARPTVLLVEEGAPLPDAGGVLVLALGQTLLDATAPASLPAPAPDTAAYVLYTSGSTGRPKGVLVNHRSLLHHTSAIQQRFALTANDRVLQFAALHFDVSLEETLPTWATGGTVVLWPFADVVAPHEFQQFAADAALTLVNLPTPYWHEWARESLRTRQLPPATLRLVITGSDRTLAEVFGPWQALVGERLTTLNAYGLTETTVTSTLYHPHTPLDGAVVPIGMPVPHVRAYVLGAQMHLLPQGTIGELYIGGAGVARGYVGRPDLTAERFVPDPFSATPGARLYRTGDLVRYTAAGDLVFVGRADAQVKVRGVRIEPGEIEAVLAAHPDVVAAVVEAHGTTEHDRQLVAYVVLAEAGALERVQAHASTHLPATLIPAVWMPLDALPLTATGKLNRRALPAPTAEHALAAEPPATETEQHLASIWSAILRIEHVSRTDSFFDRGGHSLLATQMISRIREQFGVELPLRTLFETPTLAGLAGRIEQAQATDHSQIVPLPRDGAPLPLSFAQQRLWFLSQWQPDLPLYNLPLMVEMLGPVDEAALHASFNAIIARHEILRTVFPVEQGAPRQEILPELTLPLQTHDLRHLPAEQRLDEQIRLTGAEINQPFDLERGPLVRLMLVRMDDDTRVLLLTMHHIISDDWSVGVVLRELHAIYPALASGQPLALHPLPVQYADFARWQREWLQGEERERQLSYWKQQFTPLPPVLALPTDRPRPPMQTYNGAHITTKLPPEQVARLQALAREEQATPFMVLLAAYTTMLTRYSGQDDIAIGTPIAGRTRAELEPLIGFFVNTLVIRADLSGNPTFHELIGRVRQTALDAFANQDIPFEQVVDAVQPVRDVRHSPLFQAMLVLQNTAIADLALPGIAMGTITPRMRIAKFDLSLTVSETTDGLWFWLEYNTDLFDAATADRMMQHLLSTVDALLDTPGSRIRTLPLLNDAERQQILRDFNATERAYPTGTALHTLLEEQAARTPTAPALVYEGTTYTYHELDAHANRLAHALLARGVGPGAFVGILLERSPALVVALLAVLKAGGAYVPLDPDYPAERLQMMVEDAAPQVVLAGAAERTRSGLALDASTLLLPPTGAIEGDWPATAPNHSVDAEATAYAIFTSGSTGRPKGAMNSHRAIVNRLLWMQEAYQIGAGDRILQKTPSSFDVSVWEFFLPLLAGSTLVLARPEGHKDPAYLAEIIQREAITALHFVPSMLRAFLAEPAARNCTSIRQVFCSGEALAHDIARMCLDALPQVRLHNLYGPTEAAVDVTAWTYRPEDDTATPGVPIGLPVANTRMYVLDAAMQPVPIGVAGDLYIGGVQVGQGYLHRPALTAERFIPDPFSRTPGARLYRTGDLARYTRDGALVFLGRSDDQVKLRGQRIELGDIETALRGLPEVHDAAVMVRERQPGDSRLVAYLVPAPGQAAEPLTPAEVRAALGQTLPEHMLPNMVLWLASFPLTPSGKLSRGALPMPTQWVSAAAHVPVPPRTPAEQRLADIWAEVLGQPVDDVALSFFDAGGHSLLATQVLARVRSAFGAEVPLQALFTAPTIAEFVQVLAQAAPATHRPPLVAGPAAGLAPLAYAQQRLWFLEQIAPGTAAYIIAGAFRVNGPLDTARLRTSLDALVQRHAALRTTFPLIDGVPHQQIAAAGTAPLVLASYADLPAAERETALRRRLAADASAPFDLAHGPLFRASLLHTGPDEHTLLLAMHHIISDGWSFDLLVAELMTLYRQGDDAALPVLPVQYADYARWQRTWLEGEARATQLGYWQRQLAGAPTSIDLPTDRPRPPMQSFAGAQATITLPAPLIERLGALGRREGATLFMGLLAGFSALLMRYTGQDDLSIGTPVAGRVLPELEGVVGCFVNTLVLRTSLAGGPSFREAVRRTRQTALEAFAHQDVPFDQLVEALQPPRDTSRNPLYQVALVLQNTPRSTLDAGPLQLAAMPDGSSAAQVDLTLYLTETADGVVVRAEYATALFDEATVTRLLAHYRQVLEAATAAPDRPLTALPVLHELDHAGRYDWLGSTRIDLRAIEDALNSHPAVHAAAALVARPRPTDERLIAWAVAPDMREHDLEAWLTARLPAVGALVHVALLDALPLLPDGRTDTRALLGLIAPAATTDSVAPRNDIEAEIAAIWADVLGVERVGVTDSFFDLGGHSLLATQIIARIRDTFAVELPLRRLFTAPTVAGLSEAVIEEGLAGADSALLADALADFEGASHD